MPVAESLACGTPVVSSNRGSLPEVGGQLALQCDPNDGEALLAAVRLALHDSELRTRVEREGPNWVKQFQAPAVAQKLHRFYVELN